MLTFVGTREVQSPYYEAGYYARVIYFSYFLVSWVCEYWWDYLIVHLQFRSPAKN